MYQLELQLQLQGTRALTTRTEMIPMVDEKAFEAAVELTGRAVEASASIAPVGRPDMVAKFFSTMYAELTKADDGEPAAF